MDDIVLYFDDIVVTDDVIDGPLPNKILRCATGGIYEWHKVERGDCYTDWQS